MVESPSILVTETIACRGSRIPGIIQQNKEMYVDLEGWSSLSLGVEGELQCIPTDLEHKETRITDGILQRILTDLDRKKQRVNYRRS